MVKTSRASPGVGHNSDLAGYDAINRALAMEILDQEEALKLRERRKEHRKAAEGQRVNLKDLDTLYSHRDDAESDIIQMIRRQMHYLGVIFKPLRAQLDLYTKASESVENQHAAQHTGRMAGLKGLECSPPPNLTGEDQQLWTEGWHDGSGARKEAEKIRKGENKTTADAMAAALAAKPGEVLDGTGKGDIRSQATADMAVEAARLGDDVIPPMPLVIVDFPHDNALWTEDQKAVFKNWFDAVPTGSTVSIPMPHEGAVAEFKLLMAALFPKPADDGFAATDEELAAQSTRKELKERQEAETPDPAEVAAAAKKLADNGFAPKKGAPKRLPGEKVS